MLVLSRRVGERLLIGDDIVVTVIEVRSDGVRLGIDAPRSVRVHRAEVLEAITASNLEASANSDDTLAQLRRLVPRAPGSPSGPQVKPPVKPQAAPQVTPLVIADVVAQIESTPESVATPESSAATTARNHPQP